MQSRYIAGLCAAFLTAGLTGPRVDQPLNVRLGYPADSKLLIINADDLAMSHSENDASLTALDRKLVTSATVMVPCPCLEPTHLDAHMHSLYATPELFAVLRKVARDYRLPIRMARNEQVFRDLLPYVDAAVPFPDAIFSPLQDVQPAAWKEYYLNVVKNLQPGVAELFVHLAHDDAEMRAVTVNFPVWDAAWRQRDVDVMSSPEFRKALVDNHVILIGWRPIQKLIQ